MRLALAQMTKTDSGYTIKYPEAVEREQPVPTSIVGMDDAQIEVMIEMQLATGDNEDWNHEQREEKREEIRGRLREIRERFSTRTQKIWMIEMRDWAVPISVDGFPGEAILRVLVEADRAHERLMTLIRSGVQFHGPLQPIALIPPGPPTFG
jgi:hypothetical protein